MHEIAPVFLKNEGRVEALFTLYFLALLVQALIERELRQAMQREGIEQLPIYPEQRPCRRPTTEQILRLFSLAERVTVLAGKRSCASSRPSSPSCSAKSLACWECPIQPTPAGPETASRRSAEIQFY